MLDIKFIRENPEKVKEGVKKRGVVVDVGKLLELDKNRRELGAKMDELRRGHKKTSTAVGLVLRNVTSGRAYIEEGRIETHEIKIAQEQKKELEKYENEKKDLDDQLEGLLMQIPNLPQDDTPVGKDETGNKVLREEGKKPKFAFEPKDYLEIAEKLDIIDVKRAAKVSGARFGYLKGEAALLEFALVNLAFEVLTKEEFTPIIPPVMLKAEMAKGMGYFEQADSEEAYYLPKDDLFLVGTAEQSIGTMHADEIFDEKDLPKRYVGFSTCFRREAGSYGKDTKGILRVHQFDKVEMFSFCHPEKSRDEHKFLLEMEEKLMKKLEIPYRVVQLCSGDLGWPSSATYDIETWMPGQPSTGSGRGTHRETHSTSNCTDFQARRLNIRYKARDGKLHFVHTLNGTAFAIGRMLVAIIENYQQKDGGIKIPAALQRYIGKSKIESPA